MQICYAPECEAWVWAASRLEGYHISSLPDLCHHRLGWKVSCGLVTILIFLNPVVKVNWDTRECRGMVRKRQYVQKINYKKSYAFI